MTKRGRAALLLGWVLVLIGLGLVVFQRLQVSSDLRSFMPTPTTPDQRLLMDQVGSGAGSRLLLLAIDGAPAERLGELSKALLRSLREDQRYSQVINGGFDMSRLDERLLPYRYLLSPGLDRQPLDAAFLHDQLQQRLDELSSPAAGLLKGQLARDPTLELLNLAQRWTPMRAPQLRDGVWFSSQGEALLLVQTAAAGFDPQAQQAAIEGLQTRFHALPGLGEAKLQISGPGYFSVVANAQTRHEADWIGRISSIGFIALLLLAYRSIPSLVFSALPIVSAALAGIAALSLAFGEVHGITLAFGFTLLGVAQEYPIRLLSHRRAGESAWQSARSLWPLLLTAIGSASIAYMAFYASGVNGLRQLAVFTVVGLLVAGFSTRYLLPWLLPSRARDVAEMRWLSRLHAWVQRLPRPYGLPWILAVVAGLMLWFAPGPFWQDDLSALTPLPKALLLRDARLRSEMGAPDVRYLLLLQGESQDAVLALSERLELPLDNLVKHHALEAVELPSRYLPSLATQRARQLALPDRASLDHALAKATEGLPYRPGLFQPFVDEVQLARQLPLLTPQRFSATPLGQRLDAMLVRYDGHWLALATLSGVRDAAALRGLAAGQGGVVRLLDMKNAAESLVAEYRTRILRALLVAGLLLVLTISLALRSLRRAWHVLAPMSLATLLVLAVERCMGLEISLFHLVSLILAGGLGLHYALFFERDGTDPDEQRRTLHATLVCVASALLVFGMFAWASIPVLRAIGLTVSLGVAFHFCLSILMAPHRSSRQSDKNG